MSEFDVHRRQIVTSKVGSSAESALYSVLYCSTTHSGYENPELLDVIFF